MKTGGGRGIRTPARCYPPVGFQDRSLQPDLGIPPCIIALSYRQELIYHKTLNKSTLLFDFIYKVRVLLLFYAFKI